MEQGVSQIVSAMESWSAAACPAGPMRYDRMTIEVRQDLELSAKDTAAWGALAAGRPGIGVFVSRPWLSALFAYPPDGVEPALILFRDARALRGVAAIALRPAMSHVRVSLLGGGFVSDCVDLLLARGFEAAGADAFISWLGELFGPQGFVLELRDVPTTSPLWGAIHRASAERTINIVLQPREVYTMPYLPLGHSDTVALDGSPSADRLRSLEKHRRWLYRRCQPEITTLEDPADITEAFGALGGFLRERWKRDTDGSALDRRGVDRFHRHVLPLLLAADQLRMIRLSDGSQTRAVFYGVRSGGWFGYYLAGYDREWAGRIHLGQVMLASAIDIARTTGATEFDFLKGAERVKYVWPVSERATLDADVFSERPAAQLTRATRAGRDVAAALSKTARNLFLS